MDNRTLWLGATGGWLVVALVSAAQTLDMAAASGSALDAPDLLRPQLASALVWVPLTVALVAIVRRRPFERGRRLRSLGVLALAVAAVILIRAVAVQILNPWVGWYAQLPDFAATVATSARNNLVIAWLLVGVAHAVHWYEGVQRSRARIGELEAGLARAQLEALSAQLNPHFLFNALNSIAELVHRDPVTADRVTVGLAALLRQSLANGGAQEIPLRHELELLAGYVEIERVRMPARLTFERAIDPAALDCYVPPFVLQPLVENAVVHAVAHRSTPGTVRLEVRREGPRLSLSVVDDGGAEVAPRRGHGLGLSNTRARLQCLYGDAASMELVTHVGAGTRATITLPARTALPRANAA
jgi:signal transduction histidine kinase